MAKKDQAEPKAFRKNESDSEFNTPQNQRRALVASIAAVGTAGLPSQWKKPIVDSVLLPVHAQTSISVTATTQITEAQSFVGNGTCEFQQTVTNIYGTDFTSDTRPTITGGYILQTSIFENGDVCTDPAGGTYTTSTNNGSGAQTVFVTGTDIGAASAATTTFSSFTTSDAFGSTSSDGGITFTSTVTATATTTVSS